MHPPGEAPARCRARDSARRPGRAQRGPGGSGGHQRGVQARALRQARGPGEGRSGGGGAGTGGRGSAAGERRQHPPSGIAHAGACGRPILARAIRTRAGKACHARDQRKPSTLTGARDRTSGSGQRAARVPHGGTREPWRAGATHAGTRVPQAGISTRHAHARTRQPRTAAARLRSDRHEGEGRGEQSRRIIPALIGPSVVTRRAELVPEQVGYRTPWPITSLGYRVANSSRDQLPFGRRY
jgi:hypothetical protein